MISHFDHFIKQFDDFYFGLVDEDNTMHIENEEKRSEQFYTSDIFNLLDQENKAEALKSQPNPSCSNNGIDSEKSIDERIENIRRYTNQASQARYLGTQDPEVILANLIMQILEETECVGGNGEHANFLDEILCSPRKLEEVMPGFEFYDNNPYREKAEKRLEKLRRKRAS